MKDVHDLRREIDLIKLETDAIKANVEKIKDKLIDHTPEHFSKQDLLRGAIGALFFGFSMLFSAGLLKISLVIPEVHFYVMIIGTILLLTAEIYFIGYSRVKDKNSRKFAQFWIKRLVAFYAIGLVVSLGLLYIFGFQYLTENSYHFVRTVIVMSVPCCIGASLTDLLKKY